MVKQIYDVFGNFINIYKIVFVGITYHIRVWRQDFNCYCIFFNPEIHFSRDVFILHKPEINFPSKQ